MDVQPKSRRRSVLLTALGIALATVPVAATNGMAAGASRAPQVPHVAPVVARTPGFVPLAVSCVTTSWCMSILWTGQIFSHKEYWSRWNGATASRPALIPGAFFESLDDAGGLSALACKTTSFCMAVGQSAEAALAFRWNGATWSKVAMPLPVAVKPAPSPTTTLFGPPGWTSVACPTVRLCLAVGGRSDSVASQRVVAAATYATWNGSRWRATQSTQGIYLRGLSCPASNSCTAVGTSSAIWAGGLWHVIRTPGQTQSQATSTIFSDVSCGSATTCIAVGSRPTSAFTIERSGSTWHAITSAKSPTSATYLPQAIDCLATTSCVAFGALATGAASAVVTVWNGHVWASASVAGSFAGGSSVSCVSPNVCMMVDRSRNGIATYWLRETL